MQFTPKIFCLLIWFAFTALHGFTYRAFAQKCVLNIEIKDIRNTPIEHVALSIDNKLVGTSDKSGIVTLTETCPQEKLRLKLSHIAYLDEFVTLTTFVNDTTIQIIMRDQLMQLPAAEIRGKTSPDSIIGINQFYVEDFVFSGQWILVLLRSRKNAQYSLELRNLDGDRIHSLPLDAKPVKLFKDALKICYVVFETSAKEISYHADSIILKDIRLDDFWWLHNFINHADNHSIILNNHVKSKPWFEYYLIDRSKQISDTLYAVRHKQFYEQYHSEYTFLSARERHQIKRLEYETKMSRYDLAARYTGFAQNIWYHEVKAPYFFHNQRHYIFDFTKDSLLIFNTHGQLISKHYMEFHKSGGFRQEIIFDDEFGEFYAILMKNGKNSLYRISIGSQIKVMFASQLSMRYPKHVKVKGGRAWYISRPRDSWQSTYLYAENILGSYSTNSSTPSSTR